jgi:hypothetical protein
LKVKVVKSIQKPFVIMCTRNDTYPCYWITDREILLQWDLFAQGLILKFVSLIQWSESTLIPVIKNLKFESENCEMNTKTIYC